MKRGADIRDVAQLAGTSLDSGAELDAMALYLRGCASARLGTQAARCRETVMYYQTRENGKYYLRPLDPDRSGARTEISERYFYERWALFGSMTDIATARSHGGDVEVF